MASLKLEGRNLGEKHRSFNKLVNKTIATKQPLDLTLIEDEDLQNLLKIEVAAANRNVDFILEVLKGEDMLYVSRALNRSTWLITDNQYAHIINPEHLKNELFPHMTVKAFNKFLLSIRLHLKDETRVEEFYNYVSIKDRKVAYKWLQHCSIPFVVKEVRKNHKEIPNYFIERLTERSFTIFEEAVKLGRCKHRYNRFKNIDQLLDLLEKSKHYFKFSPKLTKHVLKLSPERIIKKIDHYIHIVDAITFAKYIKDKDTGRKKIFPRLCRQSGIFNQSNVKHWLYFFPKENRFDLISKYIINREKIEKGDGDILLYLCRECNTYDRDTIYEIYKYAPFKIAFENIKELVEADSDPNKRESMLGVILSSARNDTKNIRTLLQYYSERHINEPFTYKIIYYYLFINNVLSETDTHALDDETWEVLNNLFHSVDVYVNSKNNVQECVDSIIVRSVICGADIPEIIKSKFRFNTMKSYEKKLKSQDHKDAVFTYLYNYLNNEIEGRPLDKFTFFDYLAKLQELLNLLEDWKKSIKDYPSILSKITNVTKFNKDNYYEANLSSLYHKNKEWRKIMFEESILLDSSDKVCVNALKHNTDLLLQHKDQIMWMISNDKISLDQFLRKTRIFWSDTLAKEIKTSYLNLIDHQNVNKALVTGLCLLLPQRELKMFLEKYAPIEDKTEKHDNNLRNYIGKKVYMARPLTSISYLLPYAKGSNLQSTIPSFHGILHQLSPNKTKQCMTALVNAPTSLQKVGIRFAFQKLSIEDLTPICAEIWNTTKTGDWVFKMKSTVRNVLLVCAKTRLCQEKDETEIRNILDLMSKWLGEAICEKDKLIFKLADMSKIPLTIKPEYFMILYKFLLTYRLPIRRRRFKPPIIKMRLTALNIIELLDEDFVFTVILENLDIEKKFYYNFTSLQYRIFAALILQSHNEEVQIRRYTKFIAPIIERTTKPLKWAQTRINLNTKIMLKQLVKHFEAITIDKGTHIPFKLFQSIQSQLEQDLGYERGYATITYWKLATELIRLVDENKQVLNPNYTTRNEKYEIYKVIAPKFGEFCAKLVISDVNTFYPSIYTLFTVALEEFMNCIFERDSRLQLTFCKSILQCGNEKEVHLAIYPLIGSEIPVTPEGQLVKEIMTMIFPNLSPELRMHYYQWFHGEP